MFEGRNLVLRFYMEEGEHVPPDQFTNLFKCAEEYSRYVFEREAGHLFESLDLPDEWRLETLQRLHGLGRRVPVPAEVTEVQRGSWLVVLTFSAPVLLFILKNYVHPVIQEAWDESHLRDRILTFVRDKIFLGARQQVEQKAIESPRYGNLKVSSVHDVSTVAGDNVELEVRLQRTEVLEISTDDEQLLAEFMNRLRGP